MNNVLRNLKRIGTVSLIGLLSACSTATVVSAKPAVLVAPSNTNTQVIEQAISQALKGKKVSIASNAFLHSNQLRIQKKQYSSINAQAVDGLMLGGPQSNLFSLFVKGSSCYLVHQQTEIKYSLENVQCRAL